MKPSNNPACKRKLKVKADTLKRASFSDYRSPTRVFTCCLSISTSEFVRKFHGSVTGSTCYLFEDTPDMAGDLLSVVISSRSVNPYRQMLPLGTIKSLFSDTKMDVPLARINPISGRLIIGSSSTSPDESIFQYEVVASVL